jgi:hypothetical protein
VRQSLARPWDLHRVIVLAGRVVLWAALVVVLVAGLRSILRPRAGAGASGTSATTSATFPTAGAEAYAARFAAAYLTYSSSSPNAQASALAPFLAEGEAVPAWDGNGSEAVSSVVPAGIQMRGPTLAVVTVAAELSTSDWVYLAVPVSVSGPAMVVTAPPAFVAAPATAALPTHPPVANPDTSLASSLAPTLTAFFTAYGSDAGTQLSYLSAAGSRIQGVGGLSLGSVGAVMASPGGATRSVAVTVTWKTGDGAGLTQGYDLVVTHVNAEWYVASIEPAVAAGS